MMTKDEFRRIREAMELTPVQFGNALGYSGNYNTVRVSVTQYERGDRVIPPWIETRVRALDVDGLQEFIATYQGPDDRAEFVRKLSKYLTDGAAA